MTKPRPTGSSSAATSALILGLLVSPARAQNVEAETMFSEGESLLKEGKVAAACDAFEASNRIDARAGTSINIGICREKNGQLATAWAAYKDAQARAKDPKKKQLAHDKIVALEPRLSKLTIMLAAKDDVTVTRNGKPVDRALLGRPLPVDGGTYTIKVSAPGFDDFSATVTLANEGEAKSVEVPPLKKRDTNAPKPLVTPPVKPAPVVAPKPTEPAEEEEDDTPTEPPPPLFTGRRKVAVVVGLVGLATIGGATALGVSARGLEDDAFALCPNPTPTCDNADQANALLVRGRQHALLANVGYGVGGAAVVGAVVLWLTGGASAQTESRVSIITHPAGIGVKVSF